MYRWIKVSGMGMLILLNYYFIWIIYGLLQIDNEPLANDYAFLSFFGISLFDNGRKKKNAKRQCTKRR